jgi:hypothetical protein
MDQKFYQQRVSAEVVQELGMRSCRRLYLHLAHLVVWHGNAWSKSSIMQDHNEHWVGSMLLYSRENMKNVLKLAVPVIE